MNAVQSKTLEAYQRVLSFLGTNSAVLGNVPQLTAVTTLTSVVATLMSSEASQESNNATKKGLTDQVTTLRAALFGAMRPIAAIVADSKSTLPQIPTLKAPKANVRSGVLGGLANGMAEAATPYQQTFITAGLPPTFLSDLTTAATNLSTAITAQGTTKAQRINATQSLKTTLEQARSQLKIINPSVVTALKGNAPVLKQWDNVKRVTPQSGTSSAAPAPAAPTPALPATTVPAPKPEITPTQEVKAA